MGRPKRARELSAGAFSRLLHRLDPDAGIAGEKYEHLRRALLKFFSWRGESDPETCADETLDRVARRLEDGPSIDHVPTFAYGVARLVRLERVRAVAAHPTVVDLEIEGTSAPHDSSDRSLDDCLGVCLDWLPTEDRSLILRYYTGGRREKIDGRVLLAKELSLTQNALRHRAQRLRDRLRQCARRCLEGSARTAGETLAGHESDDTDGPQQRMPIDGRRQIRVVRGDGS